MPQENAVTSFVPAPPLSLNKEKISLDYVSEIRGGGG